MTMSEWMERWICVSRAAIVAMLVVVMTGCETTGGIELTDDERALRDQSQVFNETVLGGAAVGAGVGGITCMLLGQSAAECIPEMIAGAAVGAAGGYLVAAKQEAAAEQVRQTDIVTRDVVADNEKIAKSVALARNVLDENRAAVTALRERIASNEAEAGEAEAMEARLRSNIETLNTTISKLNERKQTYVDALAALTDEGEDTSGLSAQVREMEAQITQLVEYRSALEEEIDVELMG